MTGGWRESPKHGKRDEERQTDRQRCGEGDRQHRGMRRRQRETDSHRVMDTEPCTKLETWEEDHKTEKGSKRQRWKKETERTNLH